MLCCMKWLVIWCLLIAPLSAANIPDGAWNGKLWDRNELLAGVQKQDPDALAEWAYCARRSLLQLPYDAKLIYQRAKQAAQAGSLVGMRLEAKCQYLGTGIKQDEAAAMKKWERLVELGMADAMVDVATYSPTEDATKCAEIEKLLDQADAKGAIRALGARANLLLEDDYAKMDRRESYRYRVKAFRASRDVFSAMSISYLHHSGESRGYEAILTPKLIAEARAMLQEGVELNHPNAMFRRSWEELELPGGDKHKGVMLQVRAANLGNLDAVRVLTKWMGYGYRDYHEGKRRTLVKSNVPTARRAARYAYDAGIRENRVVYTYATQMARGGKKNHPLAEKLLKGLIANGFYVAHDELGLLRVDRYIHKRAPKAEADLGFANLYYLSNRSSDALYYVFWLCAEDEKYPCYDLVRGAAAAQCYLKNYRKSENQWVIDYAEKLVKKAEQFSEKESKEYRRLVELGYPMSEKYRREAFEMLKKAGDIPADARFAE